MTIERDEEGFEPWPTEVAGIDRRLTLAIGEVIAIVFEMFPASASFEHRVLMTAVLDLHSRVRGAQHKPKVH